MAAAFSNKLARAVGVVTTSSSGSIGVTTNLITGISTTNVTVGDLVDNHSILLVQKFLQLELTQLHAIEIRQILQQQVVKM